MKYKSQISILLVIALIMGCMGWAPATAQQVQEENVAPSVAETSQKESLTEDSKILDYVDSEQFLQSDHIARLPQEETLDSYVFLNRDGSKSIYYMGHPVKYVDENGSIREKDTTLVRGNGGYRMRDNDVALHIPDAAATGITMSHNKRTVKLIPQGGSGSALQQDNSIAYVNYFGKGTILRYTPMLSGMKEDIILAQYTGQNSFTFLLETNGLNLYEDQGMYYLAESQNAEAVFYLGQIEVYDAIGRPDLGTMTVETVVPGQRYRLTVSADEDFLTDPKTVYPVTIDPTLTVRDTEEVRGTLEDTPVYSYYPNGIFGNYVFNPMGFVSDHGIGKTAVRLTSLLTDTNYSQLTADQLNSVTFYIKGSGGYYQNVSIHALTENSTWTEMTLTWNTLGAYTETAYATKNMGGAAWNAFNITNLAKDWKNGIQNPQCGFVMVSDSTTSNVSFFSGEYGTIDYRPYVVVNYTNVITLDQTSATLYKGDTLTLSATTIPAGQTVTWESDAPTVASVSGTGVVTGQAKGNATITAKLKNGPIVSCEIEVLEKIIDFRYNIGEQVYKGNTITLTPYIEAADGTITWTSLTPEIATVENGVVTGVSPGNAVIKASLNGGPDALCELVVLDNTISMDASVTITKGDNGITLIPRTEPPGLPIRWSSSDPTVVSVSQSGEIMGLKAGDAVITASLSDDTSAECTVIVRCSASFDNPPKDIDIGKPVQLQLDTNDPIDIVWTSSNENVATVSDEGNVTGIRPGTVTVTATSRHLTRALSCTIYVTLEDGIYYFQNINSGHYLHIPNGPIQNRNGLVQNALFDAQYYSEYEQIRQFWRIKHLGSGKYTIRPMLIPQMCLCVDINNNVFIEDRGTSDSVNSLMEDAQWGISAMGSGYILTSLVFHKGSLQVVNSSLTQGAAVNVAPIMESDSVIWNLSKLDNPPTGVALLDANTGYIIPYSMQVYLALNEEWTLEQKNLMAISYSASSISQSFEWTTTNSSIASADSGGTIIGIGKGDAVISATSKATGLKISIHVSVLPLANGTYLLKNRQNNCFVTASGQTNMDGLEQVYQANHGFTVDTISSKTKYNYQAWVIESIGNGYYSIQLNELKELYLSMVEDDMGRNHVELLFLSDVDGEIPSESQWQIMMTENSSIRFISRTGQEQNLVIKTTTNLSIDKVHLGVGSYTDDTNYQDEWVIAEWGAFLWTKTEDTEFNIQLVGPIATDPDWCSLIIQAAQIWSVAVPGIHISFSTQASNITMFLEDMSGSDSDGETRFNHGNDIYEADIALDSTMRNDANYRLHVIIHEIGHVLGLADNPPVESTFDSVMCYGQSRESLIFPCAYDIANVKFIYNILEEDAV